MWHLPVYEVCQVRGTGHESFENLPEGVVPGSCHQGHRPRMNHEERAGFRISEQSGEVIDLWRVCGVGGYVCGGQVYVGCV